MPSPGPVPLPSPLPTLLPTPFPKAGLRTWAPPVLVVSEDQVGAPRTARFALALTAEPLSAVAVSAMSRVGGVAFSPPVLYFDFTNFSDAVNFTAYGVDDDGKWCATSLGLALPFSFLSLFLFAVDQGDGYADSVHLVVRSEDSMTECEAAKRPACGQGAFYGNVTADVLNATVLRAMVLDDDVAGVAMTLINGNATYDNFGDALAAASYTLSLTSKPQSAVTLSVGGLGPFAVAVPTNVTIAPEDWATPVAFAVEASAPTAARPACASGARFCAAVAGRRTEAVTHAVASADPLYASLGLSPPGTDVALSVGVVHDAHAPPEVTGGRFSDLLNAIEVTFDTETDRANLAGSFACSRLLNLTAEAADMLFGDGSSCAFTSADTLKVHALMPPLRVIVVCSFCLHHPPPPPFLHLSPPPPLLLSPLLPLLPSSLSCAGTCVRVPAMSLISLVLTEYTHNAPSPAFFFFLCKRKP